MKTDRRRDEMDELLRSALDMPARLPGGGPGQPSASSPQSAAPSAAEDCPAPGDVAALVEGRLSGDERDRLERHFSTCAACQETLAAIAGMPPSAGTEAVAPRLTWLSPARLRWLVPVAAAAVLLVAYVATNPMSKRAVSEAGAPHVAMKSKASLRATPTAQASAVTAPPHAAVGAQNNSGPRMVAKSLPAKPDAQAVRQPQQVASGGAALVAERRQVEPLEEARSGKPEMVRLKAGTVDKSVVADRAAPAPAGPAQPVALPPPPLMTEQRAAPVARSFALSVSPGAGPGTVFVEAPDRRSLWRFVPDSGIWHSADAGKSWQQQAVLTSGRLAAGAAPDAAVCWAVGRGGLVMLTIDGVRWQTASAPVRADLVAVQASDARTAIVTATDGRRFTTTDGGASWTPVQ